MVLLKVEWFRIAREHVNGFPKMMRLALEPMLRVSWLPV